MSERRDIPTLSFAPVSEGWPNPDLLSETTTEAVRCPVGGTEMIILREAAEVQACLTDTRFGFAGIAPGHVLTGAEVQHPDGLLRLDSPRLNEFRGAINRYFSSRYSESMRPVTKIIAAEVADALPSQLESVIDFSRSYSEPFIAQTVCSSLGVNIEDWPFILASSEAALAIIKTQEDVDNSRKAWDRLYEYYDQVMQAKKAEPDQGIISQVVGNLTSKGFTDEEIVRTCASISNGFPAVLPVMDVSIVELLQRPLVVKECLENPEGWAEVVDELMRYKAHFSIVLPRVANEEVRMRDKVIPAGTVVLPSLTGAARDPQHTEYPDQFIPGQKGPRNIVFGAGTHFCPGAALTRQWLEVGLSSFFERFPKATLSVPSAELEWQEGTLSVPQTIPVNLLSGEL